MFHSHDRAVLRRARNDDAARIARVYIDSQRVNSTAASRASLDSAVVQRWVRTSVIHDEVWVLEEEFGRIVGVLALSGNEIETLDVDPAERRRGHGGRLLALAKSRRPGGLVARVGAGGHAARTFLTHHGFTAPAAPAGAAATGPETLNWRSPGRGSAGRPFRVVSTASGVRG